MNKTILAALIGAVATISAAIIGLNAGKSSEQKNIQNEINEVMGDMVNIIGDDNEVTINDIKDLVEDYQNLQKQNKSLTDQNIKYFDELTEASNKIQDYENQSNTRVQELEQQLNESPDVQFKDIGLSVDGENIPINSTKSSAIINNRTYYSDEFVKSLISSKYSISIQDDTMYIGKIIKEKSYLSDEWVLDSTGVGYENNLTDSYGNIHTNALRFYNSKCSIIYNLNSEYSLLKCNISIRDNAYLNQTGVITIKADDTVVYTSSALTKTTEPFGEEDIPINNCSLLTIEYTTNGSNQCIMDNIVVYN